VVSKALKFLNREVGAVNQAALLLGIFTLLSQVLGLVRDRMFTSTLGAGSQLDVYYASFQMPDIIFNLVATLVSVTVLLPILLKITEEDGEEKTHYFFSQIFTSFIVLIIFISILAFVFAHIVAPIVAPGFDEVELAKLVRLSRIMLLSPIILGISNLFASITQMKRRFILFAASPLLYNLGIIIGIVFFYEKFGLSGLAYGVVLGSIFHMIIQIPFLLKDKMFPRFVRVRDWAMIRTMAFMSLPRTFGLVVHSVTILVLISLATSIGEGSVSILRLSMNLQNVPLALVGASFSVAAFPALAKDFTTGNTKEFLNTIGNAARQIIFWSIPITVLFIVLRAQIVRVILGSQTFTWEDTRLAAATVAMFVISVTAQSLILLFTRAFYATGDTKRPVLINIVSSAVIIIFSLIVLYVYRGPTLLQDIVIDVFHVNGVPGARVVMLAFAYSVGSLLNAFILIRVFQKRYGGLKAFGLQKTFQESLLGALVMGLAAYVFLHIFDGIFDLSTFGGIFLQGFLSGIIAIGIGLWIFYLIDNDEYKNLVKALRRKFGGVHTVSVAHEDIG
jgi:putative peptidoglycan lipid II flippase